MNEWDHDYIEHLIQRDTSVVTSGEQDWMVESLQGRNRYFWDFRQWPIHPDHRDHSVARVNCPDSKCGRVLEFSINQGPWLGYASDHVAGCEFFHTEQRQWVDDWADTRHGRPVVRDLTWTESLLVSAFLQDPTAPSRLRMILATDRDGDILRRVA